MDQHAFVFATRGQCIKGKQCQRITLKNQIFVCSQNNLVYFPNQKRRWSIVVIFQPIKHLEYNKISNCICYSPDLLDLYITVKFYGIRITKPVIEQNGPNWVRPLVIKESWATHCLKKITNQASYHRRSFVLDLKLDDTLAVDCGRWHEVSLGLEEDFELKRIAKYILIWVVAREQCDQKKSCPKRISLEK